MTDLLLIDNSNIFIGLRNRRFPFVNSRINYQKLAKHVENPGHKMEKIIVGSAHKMDSFWESMKKNGFEVITFEQSRFGEKKMVDTEIVSQGIDAINRIDIPGRLILVSGDSDMYPLVHRSHERGWRVELWTWKGDIRQDYSQIADIDKINYIDDNQDALIYHESTDADPFNESLGEYKVRKEGERIDQEKRQEKKRLELEYNKAEENRLLVEQKQKKKQVKAAKRVNRKVTIKKVFEGDTWKKVSIPVGAAVIMLAGKIIETYKKK